MTSFGRLERIHVIQGEFAVAFDPGIVFSTILGSCVAACVVDADRRVGGINHFLLPGVDGGRSPYDSERLGAHLMELLINGMMQAGARRDHLKAKIFGGARVVRGLSDIGRRNSDFAQRYLAYEGIELVARDVGGDRGRRLQFHPATGRARVSYVDASFEKETTAPSAAHFYENSDIELFQ